MARWPLLSSAAASALRLGILTSEEDSETAAGVAFGGEEGTRSAELFHQRVDILTQHVAQPGDAATAAGRLIGKDVGLLVSGLTDGDACAAIIDATGRSGLAVINAGARSDELRGCARYAFHVAASQSMYDDALRSIESGSAGAATPPRPVVMWHSSLERFGAGQLNARFQARFGRGMSGEAWAGWMAMKIAIESCLRAASTDSATLRRYLERDDTQFDGHKGVPLSFRSWDRQLRQPLYLIGTGADEVVELPRGGGNGRQRLDMLGTASTTESRCR